MNTLLPILVIFSIPLFMNAYEKKIKLIQWLSPVVCCYAVGILVGNIPGLNWDPKLARTLSEGGLMFALPMLLFATDFVRWFKLAKTTIISFLLLMASVMVVSFVCGHLFKSYDPEVWKMAGMLVGVYVGGTANLTAIGKILNIREEAFIALNAADVAVGAVYLLIILSLGVKILSLFLKPFNHDFYPEDEMDLIHWKELSLFKKMRNSTLLMLLCGVLVAVSLLASKIITGEESAGVVILSVTVLSLGLSFFHKIRNFEGSQELGHYFLLVFCVGVGSLADINVLLSGNGWYFLLCGLVLFGSIVLHFGLCYFFKIDRDTAVITSMAGIFGPAFIPPMSDVLKNRAILVSGITCALVGIAVGNFVGLFVAYLLK